MVDMNQMRYIALTAGMARRELGVALPAVRGVNALMSGGPPDRINMAEIMRRHGLTPAP